MKPTMCRIVVFRQGANEPLYNGSREHPAIINHVWGADEYPCVTLTVFPDCGAPFSRTSVPHVARAGVEANAGWRWPEIG